MGRLFRPRGFLPPIPPPPKEVPEQGGHCSFVRTSVDRGILEVSPGYGPMPIHDGACPFLAGGVLFDGRQGAVGYFPLIGGVGATGVKVEPAGGESRERLGAAVDTRLYL